MVVDLTYQMHTVMLLMRANISFPSCMQHGAIYMTILSQHHVLAWQRSDNVIVSCTSTVKVLAP